MVKRIFVVGAGTMGAGIAQLAAQKGFETWLYDVSEDQRSKAQAGIHKSLATLVEKGKMDEPAKQGITARLHFVPSLEEARSADLVIEAIVENLGIKHQVFQSLEQVVSPHCILASNTSSLSIASISSALTSPARFLGIHFFNPATLMPLVEVIPSVLTSPEVVLQAEEIIAAMGKTVAVCKDTPGFIVNRVARPFYGEALRMYEEGIADFATIDYAMTSMGGFKMGPFELMDMIGHDVNFAVTQSVFEAYYNDPRFTPSIIQKELLNAGFLGRKSGRGFYSYGPDVSAPVPQQYADCTYNGTPSLLRSSVIAEAIAARLSAAGHAITWHESKANDSPVISLNGASLYLTDGRSATVRASESGHTDMVLMDLAFDSQTCTRVAVAVADQCSSAAQSALIGVLQAAGYRVTLLRDVPGMVVMRTVAMLANEAADAVNQGVCSAADANLAMQKGVNYPMGPLAWAERIGLNVVMRVLQNLAMEYGEDRYRVSPLIRRKVSSGTQF